MIGLILKIVGMFCGLGGQYVMPLVAPFVNPLSWSILLSMCLSLYWSKENVLNSDTRPDGSYEKSKSRTFSFTSLVWYISCVTILCLVAGTACKTNAQLNPYSMG